MLLSGKGTGGKYVIHVKKIYKCIILGTPKNDDFVFFSISILQYEYDTSGLHP
jgi:hypothetical protein